MAAKQNAAAAAKEGEATEEKKSDKVAVTFLEASTVGCLYQKGETAGFDAETAERLIEDKIAVKGTKLPKGADDGEE